MEYAEGGSLYNGKHLSLISFEVKLHLKNCKINDNKLIIKTWTAFLDAKDLYTCIS